MSDIGAITVALPLAAGIALGLLYFALMLKTVRLHASQDNAEWLIPLHLLRFAIAVPAFWLAAQWGALALLLTLAGFILARYAVQNRIEAG
ncbi:MAG: ATP synthase subunit I [Alphaproteobacteria bacterium]